MGKVFPTEKVIFRGKNLHTELGDLDWFELFLYGITGRFFNKKELKVLNSIWTYTSYPDPRIWNNRVAALAGTAESTLGLGLAAAIAVSEADLYGVRPGKRGLDFFVRLKRAVDAGESISHFTEQEIQAGRKVYGYGRALVGGDERIPHFLNMLKKYGMDEGPHIRLAIEVEKILKAKGLAMNFAAPTAAVAADLGFSPDEFHAFVGPVFIAGIIPCYQEAVEKPMGTLFPLPCSRLIYEGKAPRRRLVDWERKTAQVFLPEAKEAAYS
jgi:citrate synthase